MVFMVFMIFMILNFLFIPVLSVWPLQFPWWLSGHPPPHVSGCHTAGTESIETHSAVAPPPPHCLHSDTFTRILHILNIYSILSTAQPAAAMRNYLNLWAWFVLSLPGALLPTRQPRCLRCLIPLKWKVPNEYKLRFWKSDRSRPTNF